MASGITLENVNGGTVTLQYSGTGNTDKVITIPEVTNTLVTQVDIADKITLVQANAYDIGVGQTWQDVTASRALGTTYTNSTGKPITVALHGIVTPNASGIFNLNGNVLFGAYGYSNGTHNVNFTIIIPNGNTYSASNLTIDKWSELR